MVLNKSEIEKHLMMFYPREYVPKFVKSTTDIYDNRSILREIIYDEKVLVYLTNIILKTLQKNRRFRKLDCLNVVRDIAKTNKKLKLSKVLIANLFKLFQKLIFNENQDIQWRVSVLLKNRILLDEQIEWLINNYKESIHILNRLLKYPVRNEQFIDGLKVFANMMK